MKRYIEGEDRNQGTLFPEALDDYVGEDSPARVIDVFVDDLDLSSLGFERCSPALTGRPGYHPAMLLKLYIYAYLNRIHSSRRIEVEAKRNVEVMWLAQRLSPDFKTIADFRKENGEAIRLVCREFMKLCQKLKLLSNTVAIDGSKFKGNINCDQAFTDKKIKRRMEKLEKSLDDYFIELAKIDREEGKYHKTKTKRLEDKISALKKEMQRLKKLEALRMRAPDKQIALTDPDARCMKSRGSGMVGYNVQTSVDTKSHLIVSHEVINKASDRSQLCHMAEQSKQLLKAKTLTAIGDRGYFASEDILACHNHSIVPVVPKPFTSNNRKKGMFAKHDFRYIAKDDEYECPAGERLSWVSQYKDSGLMQNRYAATVSQCKLCQLKSQCTTQKTRRLHRWKHEEVLEEMQTRLDRHPTLMDLRRCTVEHVFGTLKMWMGTNPFLTRTLKQVSTEMSLNVLAYNIKRVINLFGGVRPLLRAMQA